MYRKIRLNQIGYLPDMDKKFTICSDKPVGFSVLRSDGSFVFAGTADEVIENAAAKETNYIGDFSALTEPGRYYIALDDHCESEVFTVGEDVYDEVLQASTAFFYLQRCGHDLPNEAAGLYAHCACHTGIGHAYDGTEERDVTGGWHDAGDYGRYVGPGAMAVAQMLYAYERNPELCNKYVSPEKIDSPFPPFLEELKYELDWMMKMQRADGALYHKATCKSFCSFVMPEEEKEPMVLSPVSVTATGDFAAVCAMAIRFYAPYDAAYAAKLEEVSKKAYAAMKTMELPGGFVNPKDITTGEYGDTCDMDERYWAAAELYKAFGDESYRADFEAIAKDTVYQGYGWGDMGSYGNLAYLSTTFPIDLDLQDKIKAAMTIAAEHWMNAVGSDGYGTALMPDDYVWGSNLNICNNGLQLYDAYKLTGDKFYLEAARAQIHYILGRNPMAISYLSGFGAASMSHPHHRPSGFLGKAMPGMISGGPCDWLADPVAQGLLTKETAPAKCFCDMTGSYSTNEVTIYWNSAFVQLLASVTAE